MVKICPYCKCENQDSFNYCSNCGRPLFQRENNYQPIESIDKKKIIIVSYIITIIFSWGGLIFNMFFRNFGFIGFIGLFLPFYLTQSNDPMVKKHGYIQIAISLMGIFVSTVLIFNIFNIFN